MDGHAYCTDATTNPKCCERSSIYEACDFAIPSEDCPY